MWFKNASIFKLPAGYTLTEIESALSAHPLRSPGPLEMATRGFVTPFNRPDGVLSLDSSHCTLLALGKNERLLPASILQAEMAARIAEHERTTGRKPGKRMRNEIREAALGELLPRAFVKHSRTLAYYDADAALLIVDSASDRACEDVCTAIREALGSFPARPLATEASITLLLTEWLISGNLPDGFTLGEGCEFKDPSDQASVVRCRNHDLTAEEIREHARCGNQVTQLALVFDQRISFVLDSRCKLRKIEFLDVLAEQLDAQDCADADGVLDAEFALMSLELRRLFARLNQILNFVD